MDTFGAISAQRGSIIIVLPIGTILYPSTAATNKTVSEFCGNTIEVTEVCERGERAAAGGARARAVHAAAAGET